MPRSKKMSRKEEDISEASEALLDDLQAKGRKREERAERNDSPFVDEDGDLKVVPTMEDLSSLMEDASTNSLPFKEILRRQLKIVLRAIEMAELAYHNTPKQGTAVALTSLNALAADLIKGIEDRHDPTVLRDEILEKVIRPLVFEFIKVLTSEAEKKRGNLLTICPPERGGVVSHEMRDLLKGVSQGCDEALDESRRILDELLGSKFKGAT